MKPGITKTTKWVATISTIAAIAALCALAILRLSLMATPEVSGLDGKQRVSAEPPAPGKLQPATLPEVPTRHEEFAELATEEPSAKPVEPKASHTIYQGRPDDPVESGPCTLTLHVIDAQSGAPLNGRVELWRLNAPGNRNWGQGDQRQASVKVREESIELPAIPAGEYRAIFLGAGVRADYAPSFYVAGAHTTHTLQVYPAREVEVWIELVDAEGEPLHEIELHPRSHATYSTAPPTPSWLVERPALREFFDSRSGGAGGAYGGASHTAWKPLRATSRGFYLGEFLESSRAAARSYYFDVRIPGGGEIDLLVREFPEPGERLVGLFMDQAEVLRHVFLPDGRDATSIAPDCQVESRSIIIGNAHPTTTWRDTSVQVVISGQTRRLLFHTWSPSEGAMANVWITGERRH